MKSSVAELMKDRGLSLELLDKWAKTKYCINGADEVIAKVNKAIDNNSRITVVGDYDVDGIMATAIIKLALDDAGCRNYKTRLPKRMTEGYGLSPKIMEEIDSGLLITVDNGIAAIDAVEIAKKKDLEVIIIDHHLASPAGLPAADLIIDPNAIEGQADWKGYCGAGLAYKIFKSFTTRKSVRDKMLSFAAVATIADCVPLIEDNRNIVIGGLKTLLAPNGATAGLRALLDKKNLLSHCTEQDIAFAVAPCLNAPGRLIDNGAELSLRLMSCYKEGWYTDKLADQIIALNEERKIKTEEAMESLEEQIYSNHFADFGVMVIQDDIPDGLLGLCAGKIAEKYRMPTMIFGLDKNGFAKGSVRTYGDFNIKTFLDKMAVVLEDKCVIRQYGGHAAAAGISVWEERFTDFQQAVFKQDVKVPVTPAVPEIQCDNQEVADFIKQLEPYAPFGEGNPRPIFKINNFICEPVKNAMFAVLKEKHIKLKSLRSEALWFDAVDLFKDYGMPKEIDIVGYLGENYFNGNTTPSIEIINIFPKQKKPNAFLEAMKASKKI